VRTETTIKQAKMVRTAHPTEILVT